jgi:hypothetical protein
MVVRKKDFGRDSAAAIRIARQDATAAVQVFEWLCR